MVSWARTARTSDGGFVDGGKTHVFPSEPWDLYRATVEPSHGPRMSKIFERTPSTCGLGQVDVDFRVGNIDVSWGPSFTYERWIILSR